MTEYRLQVRGERWKQKDGLSPNPKKMDSPPTPLQAGLSPNPSAREGNSYNMKKGT